MGAGLADLAEPAEQVGDVLDDVRRNDVIDRTREAFDQALVAPNGVDLEDGDGVDVGAGKDFEQAGAVGVVDIDYLAFVLADGGAVQRPDLDAPEAGGVRPSSRRARRSTGKGCGLRRGRTG